MPLMPSFLIGCATGLRSMSPLAVVSAVRRRPASGVTTPVLIALAVLEAAGDKLPFAPNRTVPLGLAARVVTGGVAGAALAPRSQRVAAIALGAIGAVGAAYLGVDLRRRAMRRIGRVSTGVLEDALAGGAALWLARSGR